MKTLLTTVTLVSLTTLTAFAATEENIHETKPTQSGGKLVVDVDFGTIDVAAGDNDKVIIEAHREISASSREKEKEYLAAAPIKITAEGDMVTVQARREDAARRSSFWDWGGPTKMEARYTIKVPAQFNAELHTNGGAISASGVNGTVQATTSGGNLHFDHALGKINARTSGGGIDVAHCEGNIDVETSGGTIKAMGGRGKLRASTSGGSVTVGNFAGDADVESSGGKLILANISGKVRGETSGGSISAIVPTVLAGDVHLETSAGGIEVVTPSKAACTIDAETGSGSVTCELPITRAGADEEGLRGTVNGGGKLLHLRSGAGSIVIRPEEDHEMPGHQRLSLGGAQTGHLAQ